VIPSQANFVLAPARAADAGAIYRALKGKGILVRFFDKPGLQDKLRITIGTARENDQLLAALCGPMTKSSSRRPDDDERRHPGRAGCR
jgi:histidinol-phosphate aminotransferase